MEQVIGEYCSQSEAERAVRWLEAQNLSVQDMVVADLTHPTWRKLHPREGRHFGDWVNFVVFMRGEAQDIARARVLLSSYAPAHA